MYKIGVSCCGAAPQEENFKAMGKNNISAMEFMMREDTDCKVIRQYSEKYNVDLWSSHLPFLPFEKIDISSLDKNVRKYAVEFFTGLIKKGGEIGIDKFVIHPSGEPIELSDREEKMKASMESLNSLCETADKYNAVIAVEDLPRTCLGNTADEILRLISVNDKLRVCLDTNHLLIDDNITFMEKLKTKIVTLHISDYDFIDERHWFPGEGKLDWNSFMKKLEEINYQGVWMYEIGMKSKVKTIGRELTYKDFYDNAMALFNKTEIPVIK